MDMPVMLKASTRRTVPLLLPIVFLVWSAGDVTGMTYRAPALLKMSPLPTWCAMVHIIVRYLEVRRGYKSYRG